VLPGNLPLWNLIRENRTYQIASLQQRGKALGIVRLDESLAALVRAGKTTMEIAKTVAEQPEHLEAYVAGRSIIAMPDQGNGPAAVKRPGQATPADGNPAINAAAGAGPAAAAAAKKTAALGKTVLSRAGRLFGSESE
jgi:twitching motility protein PilT